MVKIVVALSENTSLGLPLQPLVWALAFGPCLGGTYLFIYFNSIILLIC